MEIQVNNSNDSVQEAIETALKGQDPSTISTITTLKLIGDATRINELQLLLWFRDDSGLDHLTTLDMSEMEKLEKISIGGMDEDGFVCEIPQLTTVHLPPSVQTIGTMSFMKCPNLHSINLPAGLETIEVSAFEKCGLTAVTLPAGLQTINNFAFSECDNLATLIFEGNTPPTVGKGAFAKIAQNGCIVYPAGASGYTDEWKTTVGFSDQWTLSPAYRLTVVNGTDETQGIIYLENEQVSIRAQAAPSGRTFSHWTADGGTLANAASASTTFTMPAAHATVTAHYRNLPPTPVRYTIAVSASPAAGGTVTGGGTVEQNSLVTVTAQPHSGYEFLQWQENDQTVTTSAHYSFTATGHRSLTAVFKQQSSSGEGEGGGGSSGEGGSGGSSAADDDDDDDFDEHTSSITTAADGSTQATLTPQPVINDRGQVSVTISDQAIQNVITQTLQQAQRDGTAEKGISVAIDLTGLQMAFDRLPLTLSRSAYGALVDAGVQNLLIETKQLSLSIDLAALRSIHAAAGGAVTIEAAAIDRDKLPQSAREALGSRPAYDLTIVSNGLYIHQFDGQVTITLPYTPTSGERTDRLQMIWLDDAGQMHTVANAHYNSETKAIIGHTNHFTIFGISQAAAPVFSDITGHWASDDILYVASHRLLGGTGEQIFSPDMAMTRGMFVTALGRLAAIDATQYTGSDFGDVAVSAYYAPYIRWAAQNAIASGTTSDTFEPERPITRQEMAVLMDNYARAYDLTVPKLKPALEFADHSAIALWAQTAVDAMQRADILRGREGLCFDPEATATRAEAAAVLYRYIQQIINPMP